MQFWDIRYTQLIPIEARVRFKDTQQLVLTTQAARVFYLLKTLG